MYLYPELEFFINLACGFHDIFFLPILAKQCPVFDFPFCVSFYFFDGGPGIVFEFL
jgi:hypothetical protein